MCQLLYQLNELLVSHRIHVAERWNQQKGNTMNVFDRHTKLLQRERAAKNRDAPIYDYLKEEVCYSLFLFLFWKMVCLMTYLFMESFVKLFILIIEFFYIFKYEYYLTGWLPIS